LIEELAVRLWEEEEGQSLVEYALLLVLICLVAISSIKSLASSVSSAYADATGDLTGVYAPIQAGGRQTLDPGQRSASAHVGWSIHVKTQFTTRNSVTENDAP
jgi:Flp pilus assembly pilin Flp